MQLKVNPPKSKVKNLPMPLPKKTTPMLEQYLSIKAQYPDAILFYRMGDFYEMFFEDAKVASRALEIALTSRSKSNENSIPMCGVPHRAGNGYIARLVEQGYKVAVCDQVEDASQAKGIVKREVTRVVTPGMIVDNEFLDARSNNFVLALFQHQNIIGLACLDISTGTFRLTESKDTKAVFDEALRISPSEVLLPENIQDSPQFLSLIKKFSEKSISYFETDIFEPEKAKMRLINQFKTRSLEGFGCEHLKAGIGAAGALLYYVQETQKRDIPHISKIEYYAINAYLLIDETSARNLELIRNIRSGSKKGSLLGILDKTKTSMGGRLLTQWLRYPLLDKIQINSRLDALEEAKNNLEIRRNVRELFSGVYDLERLAGKIALGQCLAQDLTALKKSIQNLPEIWSFLSNLNASLFQNKPGLENLLDMAALIEKAIREDAPPTIKEGGIIKAGYDSELDELIHISRDGKSWLAQLENKERKATGINSLKVRFNKVFGYYIEVSKAASKLVPSNYARKQTLVNAERYITDELKKFEAKVLGAEEKRAALEYDIFCDIRNQVIEKNQEIQIAAAFVANIDCLLNLAEIADQNDYVRPKIIDEGSISIEMGRHPVVEKTMSGERFVPNSIHLDNQENQLLIITGPNMAGKSTVLRQLALIVLMAQIGSFVPAASASISIADRIFTRVGASDNLAQGQSTFMVEMEETANILNNATERSLVIMDEIGRGTSTFDGVSIAWAVAEYLHDWSGKGIKTLFATHYHELVDLEFVKPRVKNYNIAVQEMGDNIIFLRELKKGGASKSYGIQVAQLAGIPQVVVERAKIILKGIEGLGGTNILEQINGNGDGKKKSSQILNPFPSVKKAVKSRIEEKGQMGLFAFNAAEKKALARLQKIDINKMTPLEALNYLSELKQTMN